MNENKTQVKLRLLKASREAIGNLLKNKMRDMSLKEIDYYTDLLERTVMAIDFLEKIADIETKFKGEEKNESNK